MRCGGFGRDRSYDQDDLWHVLFSESAPPRSGWSSRVSSRWTILPMGVIRPPGQATCLVRCACCRGSRLADPRQ